jgi:hypothetical protein
MADHTDTKIRRQPEQPQPAVEVVPPDRNVPLGEQLTAPDIVDQHVQAAMLVGERLRLLGVEVVDPVTSSAISSMASMSILLTVAEYSCRSRRED